MCSLNILTAVIAALSVCKAKGSKSNKSFGWYTSNKPWFKVDACIKACVADHPECKSISWDPKQKVCGMYTHAAECFKIEGVSHITYYDTACGFADSVDTVCGRTDVVGADDLQPYGNKVVEDDNTCFSFCKSDSSCKAVRFDANGKRCYKHAQTVNAIGVKFTSDVRNTLYDIQCVNCPAVVVEY